jgi:amino acid adenylation domain-containing protein
LNDTHRFGPAAAAPLLLSADDRFRPDLDATLVEVLRRWASVYPDRIAYRFLEDGEEEGSFLTYAELDRRARAVAAFLQREGGAGERALLLFPPGLDFVVSFLGCLYAGTVAVPAYPPRANRPDSRLQAIARDARPRFALATPALRDRADAFTAKNPELAEVRWIATEEITEIDPDLAAAWEPGPELTSDGLAFLQYTSGSTATPKGVAVRHGNLVHNERMIQEAFGQSEESVIVGWLPLYHDMGLIGNVLQPLYVGATCVLMAPVAFLQRPVRWLRAISRYRATTSGGPNFAYELCARKVTPEERRELDLSSWRVAYNGAEPVRAETLERFAEAFAECGFRRESFYPCYGLAEATLFVSGAERGVAPHVLAVDAEALERNRAEAARAGAPSRSLVSCGSPWLGQQIAIVEPESRHLLGEGEVGEVWISGPSVAGGYWERPEESARTFGARLAGGEVGETFLRTGDLGFLAGGQLYLTGRAKDLIIVRGRNLYPQDLELTAERSHADLRPGCGAAFAVEVDGEERLVLAQEVERDAEKRWAKRPGTAAEVAEAVRRAVATEHEVAVHAVVLLRAGSVPKTSSGKIRRQSCRADFLAGHLEAVESWNEGSAGAAGGEAPRTPTEQRLERIWAEVLGLERVGVERDLFELGADSLRATQLLARIGEAFGVEMSIDTLFGFPTIAELAEVLDRGESSEAALPRLERIARDGELPLSFAQRRLWFLHQLDPDNPVHNIAATVRMEGQLDVTALAAVFPEVVRRHEALRTGFASPDEEPVQVVLPPPTVPLPVFDLSGLPAERREEETRRHAAALARLPFPLVPPDAGPFLRVALVKQGEEEHELLLLLHHIASDGGSLAVLVRELGALYGGAALPEPPVQYVDYAAWQRRRLDAGGLEAGLAHWREKLAGELPVVELPADRPRPAVLSYRGAHHERLVPARLVERLEALARDARATRFMALLAGFEALLHRYTGLDDLVVGTPIDGRNRVELEGLIGVFLNNLVLRTRLDGAPGLRDLIGRVRRTALDAYAHQEVPFERLVDELRPERDLSRTPLFQIMFVGQNAPLRRLELPGLTLHPREVDLGTARFDLSLSMGEADGGWLGIWKYGTDLFDAPTMARLAGHLESLLAAAVAEPERPIASLPLLAEAERHQVVEGWNDTAAPFPESVCLHEGIEDQVRRTPDAIAVQDGERTLTYGELNRRANRLARHLARLGVGPDALVGIAAERSLEMVVGLLGILKAGAAYVPMDPSYPADRLAYMLVDSGVGVLLTQGQLAGALPPVPDGCRMVNLDDPAVFAGPDTDPASGARPDSLAYAIYTSGSTGRPKGAGIPHRGIVNRLHWMQRAYGLTADDRVLQKTPFSFDVSVWEFFWPLRTGARLVMAPPGAHQDAARLAELIREHGITTLHFVPSMLQVFLDQDGLADSCRSVRQVFASGEALPFDLKERFLERLPNAALHNLYGPTEASVDVTFHAAQPGGRRRIVPIGRPIDNTAILLLDREGEPVPVGVPGELHIGGAGLARGYLGRPELTAERFVPDAFGTPGSRLYRTGDLARFRPDGEVEFLGRLDHQVKIRGVRIELGEIEAALASHPGVREAVVLARRDGGADPRLAAYLVPSGEDAPTVSELRAFLRERLPEAMVPAAFVVLPSLPLNPSGKIDRKALPAPDADSREERAYEAPRDELERRLAAMWSELLGIDPVGQVGIHDSFFELGGDSIQGAMFINRLQKELGRIVYVMALFDAPTVERFAEYLTRAYPDAVERLGGMAKETAAESAGATEVTAVEPALEKLRAAVARRLGRAPGVEPPEEETVARAPRIVILLSPFRSGSTLLRVMMAGHSGLFAPPELELLAFRTMRERRDVYSGRNRFAVEGLLRAVMELHGCDADRAREIVAAAEEGDVPVIDFYRRLQEWSHGRLVVDKTPSYALDLPTLRRAERLFEAPLYVHLIRHPRATIDSYLEAKMDQVYGFPFPPEEQAELVWLLAHRNILGFLEEIPAERRHRLRFEDMVKEPRAAMEGLSRFLGLELEEAMLEPYQGRRMTDGLHAGTRMMGDPKFHQHRGIDAAVADRWQRAEGALSGPTRSLAAELGYPAAAGTVEEDLQLRRVPREPGVPLPLSFSQERLWFLSQLDPDSPAYNMPAAIRLDGTLDTPALALSFAEVLRRHEVLRTVFPPVRGQAFQEVLPVAAVAALPVVDLSALSAAARDEERQRLALEEGRRPFDLARGPMLRTTLLRLDGSEHVLLVTMHHIASDGWTIGILIHELEALYTAFSRRRPSPLPELPIQYADYGAWQRRWLDSRAMEQHLAYWRGRLSGRLPVLEMPTDRPRPALLTSRGARFSHTVPSAATEEVRSWSQREGVTLFLTLLAGFDALLHRYTGQDDVVLGIPIANRNRLEVEGLIGFFLNMVPQRADLSGDPTFRELLARVAEGFLGSTPHQEVPFEKLVEDLQPERDLSRTPIFQVQFSLQNTPTQALELPGLTLTLLENHNRTTKFDFTVFLFDQPGGLTTTLEYNVDLFDEATIERFLRHWGTLLTGAVASPGLRLGELPVLAPEERAQLLTGWNTQDATFADAPSLHRIFERRAAERPDAVAAVYEVEELTYRRLNERANRLARRLRALGVGPEVPVGLCVERSLDTFVGLLGILKAGGAYVPLDPAYPPERLSWILVNALSGSAAPVLVTQSKLLERFRPEGSKEEDEMLPFRLVLLDQERASLAAESPEDLPDLPGAGPDNIAYVIYTSGSTGRPKGVPVPHANVVRLFTATEPWFGFGPDDVWTVFHSYAFDFSVWEIWGALLYGGRLVMVPRDASVSPAAFYDLLVTEGVTVLNQTPSAFRQLIQAEEEEAHGRSRLALRQVIFGGEALDLAALAPWVERHGDERPALINMYGITETTVHVTYRPVRRADFERPGVSPVGGPIPDLQVHLLGLHGELLPPGIPGEIHVGGAGLARGYLTRPDLSAERFVPDPFSGRPGARLYRSGDLARRRPDGDLEYLGRIDGQVKIRGFRIELGEIESALNRHPGVRESVVMVRPGGGGDRRLVAWIVPKGHALSTHDLREHLLHSLPEYMVPAAFVSLERLPLTAHGKVDRRALPEPGETRPDVGQDLVAPRTRTEARVAEIWREVLRLEQVSIHDNFFELGGHSLLVAQLASRVRTTFGLELPLRLIFEAPTLAGLAARLDALLPEKGGEEGADTLPRAARDASLPLSFAQERLWFLDQLEPGSPLYNVPVALRLRGRLRPEIFAATFREIVRRHEALRTGFGEAEGRPVQVIEEDAGLDVPQTDLSELPAAAREAALARLAEQEARRPFDLRKPPLLRVHIVRLGEAEHAVLVTLHHIVSDGWSMGVLVREVAALYTAFCAGLPSPLPELPVQYADFAVWQRGWLAGELLEGELTHWRRTLAGTSTVLDLPADRPRPAVQRFRGRHLPVALPAALVEQVKKLALQRGSTLFMALLAAFQTLLSRLTGQEDFLVGSPVANRNREEIEGLIGFFVNTLALRARAQGDPSFQELVDRVRGVTLDAYAHQDLPFERLVDAIEPERDLGRSPLFQALFVLQNAPMAALELPELTLEPLELESGTSKFDLTLSLMEAVSGASGASGVGGIGGFLEIDADLFEEATAHRLLGHFRTLLESAVAAPQRRISELALLSPAERWQVLERWSPAPRELPAEATVVALFAAQARRSPEAVAVARGEERLTFAELDREAERLAAHLWSLGVGPESRVGIALERTPAMVVAMLGVLKTGGAYVPLDPSHPRERLALILDAARPQALVTQTGLLEALPAHAAQTLLIDALPPLPLSAHLPASETRADGDGLAYVLFTSGSTGRPKGVQISKRALVNFLLSMAREPGLGEGDVLLAVTTLSFDIAGLELLLPLVTGARVELASREEAADGELLRRRLAASGATVLQATPAMWRLLLDAGWEGDPRLEALCGGEALPADLAARLLPRVGSLWNMYGPTETTIWSATRRVTAEETAAGPSSIPVGGAIDNTRLYVLDRRGEPVPPGVPGELAIAGAGVARGYLDAPDLTAERFVPDPFGVAAGKGLRMYRTGDLVRWLPDGRIEFLGRIDFQVKVRGFRIELGEIEAALAAHPAVRQAVAGVRGDRLVAWVVPAAMDGEVPDLREPLRGKLPEYMIPSACVILPAFPLNPSGKVDRKALPEPERVLADRRHRRHVPPRDPVEEMIAAIWSELLGLEPGSVGAEDGFFELGGHSLLATQLVSRLRRAFGIELAVRQLFDAPTLERLATVVRERQAGEVRTLPPLVPVSRDGELPLSFSQERLWFLDQLDPGSPLYNIPVAMRLRGRLRPEVLAATFREIVRRHEALRTAFAEVDGRPTQVVAADPGFALPFVDLAALPSASREAELARLAEEEARRPFDLRRAPLLRAGVVRLAEDDHAALVTVHHIVSDGWSMGVLVREVAAIYRALWEGTPSPLPELPVQYADFAVWQRGWLAGEALDAELEHWKAALAGAATVLDVPADHPRPATQGFRGRHLPVLLPAALVGEIRALALREGATPFMALLAGFETLLSRITGQEDFLVGSPVANRSPEEVEGLIGFFVNTLALRARLEGEPAFRELLGRARSATLDAYAHQDLPFEKLVEALEPERDLSRSPLFQVMLVLQNAPFAALELPELRLEPVAVETGAARFDLTLTLTEGPEGLAGTLEYDADLFEEPTAARLWSHLRTVLEGAVASPGTRISELPLLSPAERRQVLEAWNDTRAELPETTVASLFLEQARHTPEAVAVARGEERLTYADLDRESRRLAAHLRSLGVGPESRVGISLERTPAMVVAVLGVLRSGGAYVPLDPSHPAERLALILESARPQALITQAFLDAMPEAAEFVDQPVSGDGLAYVLFTSGSTGRPKGVQIPQRALVNFLLSMAREPGLGAGDAILAVTTLSFDIAGLELLLPLLVGARVELASREEAADGALLRHRLAASGATAMQATPAMWRLLLDAGWEGDAKLVALCGGEALPVDLAAALLPKVGALWNMYGPTETTIWSATRRVTAEEVGEGSSIAVGGAIANTRLYVLDPRLEPAPLGVPGELAIGGAGLARGYLDAPDLTAERFVPDPFGEDGARMYRTGDLVRWRDGGRIEFLGRIDFQVKVRGFRIELGEVEAALTAHPGVRQAVAGVRGDRLVAWVITDGEVAASDLREPLRGKLPEYMIPSAFVALTAFPLNPSGKVDRKALPEPERAAAGERRKSSPRGPVEELIAGIWSELLGVEEIGPEDSFFDLGGHSLLATQLASRLRRAFGVELPVRQLFETPTLERLAEAVQAARQGASAAPPIRPVARLEGLPLSFAQERLWFVEQLEGGGSFYTMPTVARLQGDVRVEVLEACLREIVRRHEALRTHFVAVGGKPVQAIDPEPRVALPVIDLRALPAPLAEAELASRRAEHESRPFDLARGPLLRAALVRRADDEHVLLFAMHHIVSDRWSMGILVRELVALYPAIAQGRPSPLPDLPVQYADFAVWQREWLQGAVLDEQLGYWTRQLAGLEPLDLPADRAAEPGRVFRAGDLPFELTAERSAAVHALARRQGASPFMVLLAAFQTLLHRLTGQDDVAVGAPIANRNRAETEDLIGFFVNTLVLRSRPAADQPFRELLERVRETTLAAYDHQDLPFSRVVDALRPADRRQGGMALVDAMFTMQNQPMPEMELPGLKLGVLPAGDDADLRIDFALSLRMWEEDGVLKGGFGYSTGRLDRSTAERWRDHFLTVLAAAAEQPDRTLTELLPIEARAARTVVAPAEPAQEAATETVAKQRAELSGRRETLSATKRELLEQRLRGQAAKAAAARKPTAAAVTLVKLQDGNGSSRPPFFCVHAIGGGVFSYGELARRLGSGQTFYGVQAPGLEGGKVIDDVPAMAAEYVAAIEAAAPQGPYLLGGWSFGGVVAFEIARQLRERGREVALVALLDSYPPSEVDVFEGRSEAELLRLLLLDQAGIQGIEAPWLKDEGLGVEELLRHARESGLVRADLKPEQVQRLLGVYQANLRAFARYRPQPYAGRLTLFRPDGALTAGADGWEPLAAEPVEVVGAEGDHYTMLAPPRVDGLARRLAECIERALR